MTLISIQGCTIDDIDKVFPLVTVWAENVSALIQHGNMGGEIVAGNVRIGVGWEEYQRVYGILAELEGK